MNRQTYLLHLANAIEVNLCVDLDKADRANIAEVVLQVVTVDLKGLNEARRDAASDLLQLTTDQEAVKEAMGSDRVCAAGGCQLAGIRKLLR